MYIYIYIYIFLLANLYFCAVLCHVRHHHVSCPTVQEPDHPRSLSAVPNGRWHAGQSCRRPIAIQPKDGQSTGQYNRYIGICLIHFYGYEYLFINSL